MSKSKINAAAVKRRKPRTSSNKPSVSPLANTTLTSTIQIQDQLNEYSVVIQNRPSPLDDDELTYHHHMSNSGELLKIIKNKRHSLHTVQSSKDEPPSTDPIESIQVQLQHRKSITKSTDDDEIQQATPEWCEIATKKHNANAWLSQQDQSNDQQSHSGEHIDEDMNNSMTIEQTTEKRVGRVKSLIKDLEQK